MLTINEVSLVEMKGNGLFLILYVLRRKGGGWQDHNTLSMHISCKMGRGPEVKFL